MEFVFILVGIIIGLTLSFLYKHLNRKPTKSTEQSDGLLVAMHTFFKSAGEDRKANEVAGELKRRGYKDSSRMGSDIGVWNKDD